VQRNREEASFKWPVAPTKPTAAGSRARVAPLVEGANYCTHFSRDQDFGEKDTARIDSVRLCR
jgi:hypothetical protein